MTDESPTEFPREIGAPARRALALNGYSTFDQLTGVTAADLLSLHGVGPKAVRILSECLAEQGRGFST